MPTGPNAGGVTLTQAAATITYSVSAPATSFLTPFAAAWPDPTPYVRCSLLVSKAISCFARYPDRRPSGLISDDDGSLGIHQLWLHWGRRVHLTRQQLLQCITEHTFGSRGRGRFLLRSDADGRTCVSVSDPVRRFPRSHPRRDSFRGPTAAPQVGSFPDLIFVESDDDVDSVASVRDDFVVDAGTADGFTPDVKLDPEVKLESDPELEGSKPLSDSVVSIPCFPVARPETAEFFQGFSFVFTEADDFGRPVVGSPDGAQPHDGESLSFAAQLDLDLVENALAVSATIADTPEDEDLVDNTLTVSTAAADALEGVFPVNSVPSEATSTHPDSIDATPWQGQPLCPPVPGPGPHTFPVGNPNPPPSLVSQNYGGSGHSSSPSSPLDILLVVSALFCLPPISVSSSLPSVTATPTRTLALEPPLLSPTPCFSSSMTMSFVSPLVNEQWWFQTSTSDVILIARIVAELSSEWERTLGLSTASMEASEVRTWLREDLARIQTFVNSASDTWCTLRERLASDKRGRGIGT